MKKMEYNEFEVYLPEPIARYYILGKPTTHYIKFTMYYKPNVIHRFFMRVLLGWYWEENKSK